MNNVEQVLQTWNRFEGLFILISSKKMYMVAALVIYHTWKASWTVTPRRER